MRLFVQIAFLTVALVFPASISNAQAAQATAKMTPTSDVSTVNGEVKFTETPEGLHIKAEIKGLEPGSQHGFHIHEKGDCSDFGKAAGGHYNPDATAHGYLPKDGPMLAHAGDFGNLTGNKNGEAGVDMIVPRLNLTGETYNISKLALIVHEKADDYGQPTGNAGGRVACGVVEPTS